jgi:hypothetical protein
MDLTTATPVEIDTLIADHYGKLAGIDALQARAQRTIDFIDEIEPGSYNSNVPDYSPQRRAAMAAEVDKLGAEVLRIWAEDIAPLTQEFRRRGGWTRYYLVDNASGHVHKDKHCSSCFLTTKYAWLIEQSGLSAEELVELAGMQACTVCFPWAPVDVLRRKSQLESPERKAARLEREAKKAAAAAKKAAKAITTPEGNPLKVFTGHYPEREVVRNGRVVKVHPAHDAYDTLETLHSARGWLADYYYYNKGGAHPRYRPETLQDVARAVAAKEGKDVETVLAEAKLRASKR